MTEEPKKLRTTTDGTGAKGLSWWCPPCNTHHHIVYERPPGQKGPTWTWNGDLEKPTVTPSVLVNPKLKKATPDGRHRCHLFLTDGIVRFLGDCTHAAAGTSQPVEPPCF